jgi:hypothetical protein
MVNAVENGVSAPAEKATHFITIAAPEAEIALIKNAVKNGGMISFGAHGLLSNAKVILDGPRSWVRKNGVNGTEPSTFPAL